MNDTALVKIETLTPAERKELRQLEIVIEEGMQTFVAVGKALWEIRDKRLYRATHESFEKYTKDRWNFSRTHADRLISGAEAAEHLDFEIKPVAESQVRAITKLDKADQKKVWARAVELSNNKQPTAKVVAQAVSEVTSGSPSPAVVDAAIEEVTSQPRPDPAMARYVVRDELVKDFHEWAVTQKFPAATVRKIQTWLASYR